MKTIDENMRLQDLRNGILNLSELNLDEKDVKRIFRKLSSERGRLVRKKKQRLQGKEAFISRLSASCNIRKVDLSYNYKVGDVNFFSLLPDTVRSLDLSYCGLGNEGIRSALKFLDLNKSITSINLDCNGNEICEEDSKLIGEVLANNSTLQELCIVPTYFYRIGKSETQHIAKGLLQNSTLRVFESTWNADIESLETLMKMLLEGGGSALEHLNIGYMKDLESDPTSMTKLEYVLNQREHVRDFGWFRKYEAHTSDLMWNSVRYWLNLNALQARKIARDGSIHSFVHTLENAAKLDDTSSIFYMLRNNDQYLE
jgi:hypothetical protein